ncbi:MAG: TauD/TfdA family dioxygenase [Gammaproteobacteria bacterium]|nr:TauD/TfdA family dioxygenase [Gammaproteobacteria bacterium]
MKNYTQVPESESKVNEWKEQKLSNYPMSLDETIIELNNPFQLSLVEKEKINECLKKTNFIIYQVKPNDNVKENKKIVRAIGEQFGLLHLDHNECADDDAITALQVNHEGLHNYYIPYSNKAINWHTDGYYNPLDQQIHSMVLHCVHPAIEGGENQLLDPEMVYLQLHDQNPDFIYALQENNAMMIPKNIIDGELIRPDRSGPVFMFDEQRQMHMRYTARKRNVVWKDTEIIAQAEKALRNTMSIEQNPFIFSGKLDAGQGLLSRNILHTRSQFDNPEKSSRLLLRARYFDKLN